MGWIKWAVLLQKQYILALYSNESTCYNIAMAQVSVAQEGKLPEMHERLIILRELLTRAAPSSRGHCAFSSWKQAGTRKRSLGLFVFSAQRKGLNNAIWCKRIRRTYPRFAEKQGITQEQLSIMLNVSANHLAKVETGSRCCSIELLQDLSSCLNVRTDYLLNGDAPHNNHLRERLTFLAQELEKITADLPVWG